MTTIALNYSKSLLEGLFSILKIVFGGVKKTLQGMMIGIMIARQTQANHYVAQQISKYEYNGQEYHRILHELNQSTIAQIHKEFGND